MIRYSHNLSYRLQKNVSVQILIHQSSDVYCDESIRDTTSRLPSGKKNFFSYTSDINNPLDTPFTAIIIHHDGPHTNRE